MFQESQIFQSTCFGEKYVIMQDLSVTVMILYFRTNLCKIRLLLEEQSDQGLHCLPFRLHLLDTQLYFKALLFKF